MKVLSILYHDIIEHDAYDDSGFPGPAAARYKLSGKDFENHLEAISGVLCSTPATVFELHNMANVQEPRLLITFDDGGASAPRIAEMLEKRKWRAHFFITTDCIGKPAFVSAHQIRELRKQGHVIGSHSCSHPRRMSDCSSDQLLIEWQRSAETLTEILGEPVTVASVPGGNYSARVARTAAQAGIKFLFTSEPTSRRYMVDGCWILGRYGILRGMSADAAADFAAGRPLPRFQQWAAWNAKKALKNIGGNYYHRLRDLSLGEKPGASHTDEKVHANKNASTFPGSADARK